MTARVCAVAVLLALLAATQARADDWIRYSSVEGGFSILMCGPVREQVVRQHAEAGEIISHLVFAHTDEFTTILGYVDYPYDVDVEQELAEDRDNFVREAGAKLLGSRRITYPHPGSDPLPAMEFTASDAEGRTSGMIVVVNARRAYQWTIYTFNGPDRSTEVQRYLGSFQLASGTT
jgi:hypothetical protein